VIGSLGAGGMGEVYRARDARLGRDVAIKALPVEFARDPERVARFEREAKLLASLSDPHIAGLYGLEEVGGARYLVLERVEGESLAARLARGALGVEETVAVAIQIASGIEAAHESGIVHRDLKPANVMLTPSGTVKILDFGLARSGSSERAASQTDLSASPTITHAATQAGMILGTAAYMSPEQARGKPLDRRTDIWSFGCIVYECLTGRPLFEGETVSDLIARILERAPDWSALPSATPPRLRHLLQRCLRKDARERLRDIGDARLELEEIAAGAPETAAAPGTTPTARGAPAWTWPWLGLAVLVAGIAIGDRLRTGHATARPVRRFTIPATEIGTDFGNHPMISPDGRRVAFVNGSDFWVRDLHSFDSVEVPGTENAQFPFWSPDGSQLAFARDRKLWVTAVSGAGSVPLCNLPESAAAPGPTGARTGSSWSRSTAAASTPCPRGAASLVSC
jgi:serine/threonine protein kinase